MVCLRLFWIIVEDSQTQCYRTEDLNITKPAALLRVSEMVLLSAGFSLSAAHH